MAQPGAHAKLGGAVDRGAVEQQDKGRQGPAPTLLGPVVAPLLYYEGGTSPELHSWRPVYVQGHTANIRPRPRPPTTVAG